MSDERLQRLLTAAEVAERTGVPRWRIYELARQGEMPVVRLGRSFRFSAATVAAWLEAGGTSRGHDG